MDKLSKAELSKKYQVSARTLYSYEKAGVDIHDPVAVNKHRHGLRSQPAPSNSELQALKVEGLKLENEKRRRVLDAFSGEYLSKLAVEVREARIASVINAWIRAVSTELPALLAGMDETSIEKRVKEWREPWVDQLADARSELWRGATEETIAGLRGDLKRAAEVALRESDL